MRSKPRIRGRLPVSQGAPSRLHDGLRHDLAWRPSAQPFLTVPDPPADGPGPNPLLQNHILMAVHPPFLYLGYVGMTIPFGLAAAALTFGIGRLIGVALE